MRVQVWSYLEEYEELRTEILDAVDRVFSSGRLILGEHVAEFERAFSAYCGSTHGIGVNSGTDALFLGLKALGVGEGQQVITVPNTAVPTVSAIVSTGATPVFVDVDEQTCLMDVDKLEAAITENTACILPVHLYGQCVDMSALMNIARKHDIPVLEDCAQSAGALYCDQKAGSFGKLSAHSFYPTKNLGAYGDGGMVITDDEALSTRLRQLRMYGMSGTYYSETHGYNSRLDEVQAAILSVKLKHLDTWIQKRREIAAAYAERLAGQEIELPYELPGNLHTYYVYVARHPERDRILAALREQDIHCNISYPFPIHTMRGYSQLGYAAGDFPVTEKLAGEVFSLPMYPALSEAQIDHVCMSLIEVL